MLLNHNTRTGKVYRGRRGRDQLLPFGHRARGRFQCYGCAPCQYRLVGMMAVKLLATDFEKDGDCEQAGALGADKTCGGASRFPHHGIV